MRKLQVNGQEWRFKFGKENAVIQAPSGKKTVVHYDILTNSNWSSIKPGDRFAIRPIHVVEYIQNKLMWNVEGK